MRIHDFPTSQNGLTSSYLCHLVAVFMLFHVIFDAKLGLEPSFSALSQPGLVLVPRAVSAPPLSPLPSEPEAPEEEPPAPAPPKAPKAKMKAVRRALTLTLAGQRKEASCWGAALKVVVL